MGDVEYREYRSEDEESFLRVHDGAFPAMSAGFWQEFSRGPVTAAVAVMGGEVVGSVPFHFRDFRVRPDVSVRVAWEFSVCVREDLRGNCIGSRLMDTAKEFLRGRYTAVAVYCGDECSPGYRYYARNGHHDLLYARPWIHCDAGIGPPAPFQVCEWDQFLAHEEQYLEVFANAYGSYGGFPQRQAGYYAPAVNTTEYAEVPVELAVLVRRDGNGLLLGYAIIGEERLNPTLHLMEIAARDNDLPVAMPLLAAFARTAAERGIPALASVADSSPYTPALQALGFQPKPRAQSSMMIMFHVLDPEQLARAVWRESEAAAGLEVWAWTPEREARLHPARGRARRRVVLEMKEDTLTRLLLCRLDLKAALAQEMVTAVGASAADVEAIAEALPFTPWAYHYLDFI